MKTSNIGTITHLMRVAKPMNFEDMTWFTRIHFQLTMRHLGIADSVAVDDGNSPNRPRSLLSTGVFKVFLVEDLFLEGDVSPSGSHEKTRDNLNETLRNLSDGKKKKGHG